MHPQTWHTERQEGDQEGPRSKWSVDHSQGQLQLHASCVLPVVPMFFEQGTELILDGTSALVHETSGTPTTEKSGEAFSSDRPDSKN